MINISIASNSVDVPGGKIYTQSWVPDKTTSKPPVILLHDSLGCVDLWRNFPEALARHIQRPVHSYDRLGFGHSSERKGVPSLDFIAEEAKLFFPLVRRALGITRYSLFGHSVGGAMALMIAALHPKEGLVSVMTESAQAFVEQRTVEGILTAQEQFKRPGQFNKLTRWHGDKARWVLDAWTKVWLSPAFASWRLDPYLGKVQCPVMAIHGALDEYGSIAFPYRIVNGVDGPAEMELIDGCGHVPHRERPDVVLKLVSRFLEEDDLDA